MLNSGILAELNPLTHVVAVPLFQFPVGPWQVAVSNHMFMVTVVGVLLLTLGWMLRRPKLIPSGFQNAVESVCEYLREDMVRPVLHEHTDKYIGFIWTLFFFVLTLNLLGMVPSDKILYLVTRKPNHLGGGATANIWITGALALITFCMTHVAGIKEQGLARYLANLAPPAPKWLLPLIYPLELIGVMVKPFTLAVRLFANLVAGHLVLATLLGLILIFKSLGAAAVSVLGIAALSLLELLVAFIQAYVFAFLSTLYIGASVSPDH